LSVYLDKIKNIFYNNYTEIRFQEQKILSEALLPSLKFLKTVFLFTLMIHQLGFHLILIIIIIFTVKRARYYKPGQEVGSNSGRKGISDYLIKHTIIISHLMTLET
jgi:hypothetical protein